MALPDFARGRNLGMDMLNSVVEYNPACARDVSEPYVPATSNPELINATSPLPHFVC